MKKGYWKLLIFEIVLFIIIVINSFVWNILNNYVMVVFLVVNIILFKRIFGLEKDRHRYIRDIVFDILIILLVFFLLYYLLGVITGFYRVGNYYTIESFRTILLPTIVSIVLLEYLRYQMIMKSEGSRLLLVVTCFLFVFLDITNAIYFKDLSNSYKIFTFIALIFLPSISRSLVTCYIANKVGYIPNIFWILVYNLYIYLLPIVPNPNEYILSIINFTFPFVIMYRVYSFFYKINDEEIDRDYKKANKGSIVMPTIILLIVVYFTSGYFKYYAVAVATGSMKPNINKGDVVVIERLDEYDRLKIGDVLAFKYNNNIIVHRIVNVIECDGEYYFYTKGDNNDNEDNFVIYENMVVGVVNIRVPFIGYPTVWFNDL